MPSIFDDCLRLVRDLERRGWGPLFKAHGLDLGAVGSIEDLVKPLPAIDRAQPGFEDFCQEATQALAPGRPARSLLYHALAHPGVLPHPIGAAAEDFYPTLDELDLVENVIYALARRELGDRNDLSIAVFAYQYRPAGRTAHRVHADLVFSRTGIARIGSWPALWNPEERSFKVEDQPGTELRVRPARYAAFLARAASKDEIALMCGEVKGDDERTFLLPVHKLFDGRDCIEGAEIRLSWREYHRNERLARGVERGRLRVDKRFDIQAPPFFRDSINTPELVDLAPRGSSVLVSPRPKRLVRIARQRNEQTGAEEIVGFKVPRQSWPFRRLNREFTTLHVISNLFAGAIDYIVSKVTREESRLMRRDAPEFLNIRHQVSDDGKSTTDLNDLPPDEFESTLRRGGYLAALFEDSVCDGCVTAVVDGLGEAPVLPAFSVLGAADYFPRVDQAAVHQALGSSYASVFSHGTPAPLCRGRLTANPRITDPAHPARPAFHKDDQTMVAVLSERPTGAPYCGPAEEGPISWLSDAAADHFAPGWDVTYDREKGYAWYHTYGLGSPFVEDLKLCAAGAGSWPAAAPDASRTFRGRHPTAVPLLDCELGYHPDDPRSRAAGNQPQRGWDGEYGPFVEKIDNRYWVNYADIDRSDYVSNALSIHIRTDLLCRLTTHELLCRVSALARAVNAAPPEGDRSTKTDLWLISATKVDDWAKRPDRLEPTLSGPGYEFIFAVPEDSDPVRTNDVRRLRTPVRQLITCHLLGGREAFSVSEIPLAASETHPALGLSDRRHA